MSFPRLLQTINTEQGRTVKVYRDYDNAQYVVRLYNRTAKGKLAYLPEADYFTDTLQDAEKTAELWSFEGKA